MLNFSPQNIILTQHITYSPWLFFPTALFLNCQHMDQMCNCFSMLVSNPAPRERQSEGRGIFDFTPRETSFIHFGGLTTLKKVAWLAQWRENADSIPNNMILMTWKIPGPLEDCPDATVMRNATVLLNSGYLLSL